MLNNANQAGLMQNLLFFSSSKICVGFNFVVFLLNVKLKRTFMFSFFYVSNKGHVFCVILENNYFAVW